MNEEKREESVVLNGKSSNSCLARTSNAPPALGSARRSLKKKKKKDRRTGRRLVQRLAGRGGGGFARLEGAWRSYGRWRALVGATRRLTAAAAPSRWRCDPRWWRRRRAARGATGIGSPCPDARPPSHAAETARGRLGREGDEEFRCLLTCIQQHGLESFELHQIIHKLPLRPSNTRSPCKSVRITLRS